MSERERRKTQTKFRSSVTETKPQSSVICWANYFKIKCIWMTTALIYTILPLDYLWWWNIATKKFSFPQLLIQEFHWNHKTLSTVSWLFVTLWLITYRYWFEAKKGLSYWNAPILLVKVNLMPMMQATSLGKNS